MQEGNFLFVMGGSLGKFSGYTDSVEMYSVESGNWLEGPKMSSSRYSHCAVGLGNGSIIVTGKVGFTLALMMLISVKFSAHFCIKLHPK